MGDYSFSGLATLWAWMLGALLVLFPLAIWKVVDIIIWIFRHIDVNWN